MVAFQMLHSSGINSGLDLRIDGKAVQPSGDLLLRESIFSGTSLSLYLEATDGEEIKPGLRLAMVLHPEGSPDLEVELICQSVTQICELGSVVYQIHAQDPLSVASSLSRFSTYSGGKPFGTLVREVLSSALGKLFRSEFVGNSGPNLPAAWYFQCQETANEFLSRIARLHGYSIFWSGQRVLALPIGVGNSQGASELRIEQEVVSWRRSKSIPAKVKSVSWTDPETCISHCIKSEPSSKGSAILESPGVRADTFVRPHIGGLERNHAMLDSGDQLIASLLTSKIRIGDKFLIEGTGHDEFTAIEIEHRLHGRGQYSNVTLGVRTAEWATHNLELRSKMMGPFLARVVENCDPKRQGRIRVSLADDQESRPTHWLPVLTTSGGSETGWHWLPEINELVLVATNDYSPENLLVLGSVRGTSHKINENWSSSENAKKVLSTRNGMTFEIDDVSRTISLGTEKASIKICGDGVITIDGEKISVRSKQNSDIVAKGNVTIDGEKILLAP